MALINCSECGREVSSTASSCPQCGNVISSRHTTTIPQVRTITSEDEWNEMIGAVMLALVIVGVPTAGAWYLAKSIEISVAGGIAGFTVCLLIPWLRRQLLVAAAVLIFLGVVIGGLILIYRLGKG